MLRQEARSRAALGDWGFLGLGFGRFRAWAFLNFWVRALRAYKLITGWFKYPGTHVCSKYAAKARLLHTLSLESCLYHRTYPDNRSPWPWTLY